MKYSMISAAVASVLALSSVAHADVFSDAELIFNAGEQQFAQFFPSHEGTQTLEPYLYRFYPQTGIYLGVNKDDANVYVLGGEFGNTPAKVDSVSAVMTMLNISSAGGGDNNGEICDPSSVPAGISYSQSGNTTHVTTNGQCIVLPENNFCQPKASTATGLNVLTTNSLSDYKIGGITIAAGLPINIDSLIAAGVADTKTCVVNAPEQLKNNNFSYDMCMDVSSQMGDIPTIPGAVTVTLPVTLKFKGSGSTSVVADCFATDASVVNDAVTGQTWLKQNGAFVEVK